MWYVVLVAIPGLVAGIALALLVHPTSPFWLIVDVGLVFATVDCTYLLALAALYWKGYADTHAPFSLGLAVVLSVLLFSHFLALPHAYDTFELGLGPQLHYALFAVATILESSAFALLLYLSM